MSWTLTKPPVASLRGTYAEVASLLHNPVGEFRWPVHCAPERTQVDRALATLTPLEIARRLDVYLRDRSRAMLAPWPLPSCYVWLLSMLFGGTTPHPDVRTSMALGNAAEMPRKPIRPASTVSEWWLWNEDGYGRDGQPWPDPTEPERIAEWARRRSLAETVPLEWAIAVASLHWQLAAREGMEPPPLADVRGKDAQEWMETLK